MSESPNDILTIAQAAEMLQVSTKTLTRMCARGEISFVMVGKLYRFRRAWLDSWIDRTATVIGEDSNPVLAPLDMSGSAGLQRQLRGGRALARGGK